MGKGRLLPALLVSIIVGSLPAGAEAPKTLEPLRFLLGEWQAEGGVKADEASGGFTFAASLQGRVIVRTNHADYPAAAGKPEAFGPYLAWTVRRRGRRPHRGALGSAARERDRRVGPKLPMPACM